MDVLYDSSLFALYSQKIAGVYDTLQKRVYVYPGSLHEKMVDVRPLDAFVDGTETPTLPVTDVLNTITFYRPYSKRVHGKNVTQGKMMYRSSSLCLGSVFLYNDDDPIWLWLAGEKRLTIDTLVERGIWKKKVQRKPQHSRTPFLMRNIRSSQSFYGN